MLKFQVNFTGAGWCAVDSGIVLTDGRLAWWHDGAKGIAPAPYWMLTVESTEQPAFKAACWAGLTPDEKSAALARRGLTRAA